MRGPVSRECIVLSRHSWSDRSSAQQAMEPSFNKTGISCPIRRFPRWWRSWCGNRGGRDGVGARGSLSWSDTISVGRYITHRGGGGECGDADGNFLQSAAAADLSSHGGFEPQIAWLPKTSIFPSISCPTPTEMWTSCKHRAPRFSEHPARQAIRSSNPPRSFV